MDEDISIYCAYGKHYIEQRSFTRSKKQCDECHKKSQDGRMAKKLGKPGKMEDVNESSDPIPEAPEKPKENTQVKSDMPPLRNFDEENEVPKESDIDRREKQLKEIDEKWEKKVKQLKIELDNTNKRLKEASKPPPPPSPEPEIPPSPPKLRRQMGRDRSSPVNIPGKSYRSRWDL